MVGADRLLRLETIQIAPGVDIKEPRPKSIRDLLAVVSDLLFSLDSKLWRTLIGLVRHPIRTNRAYLADADDLLHPLKLLIGLCSLSVVVWTLVPATPAFMEMLEDTYPEVVEVLRPHIESGGVDWHHFSDAVNHRVNLLNAPFVILVSLPIMLYFKLIRRDIPVLDHARLTLSAFNVYLLFFILSVPLYFLPLNLMLLSGLPLLLVLVPYLVMLLLGFHARSFLHAAAGTVGLLLVLLISYLFASNAVVLGAIWWASHSLGVR